MESNANKRINLREQRELERRQHPLELPGSEI